MAGPSAQGPVIPSTERPTTQRVRWESHWLLNHYHLIVQQSRPFICLGGSTTCSTKQLIRLCQDLGADPVCTLSATLGVCTTRRKAARTRRAR